MNNLVKSKKRNKRVLKYMMKNRKNVYNFKKGDIVSIKEHFINEQINGITHVTVGFRFIIIDVDKHDKTIKVKHKLHTLTETKHLLYYNIQWFEKEKLDLDIINIYK
jgi:hypothetical protein